MTLWDWALAAYPAARTELLDLQDTHGQSVCLLLWAAWTVTEGRPAGLSEFSAAADLARCWEAPVIAPLRAARRALKGLASDDLRRRAHEVELAAERALLERLEALRPAPDGTAPDLADALAAASRSWGLPPPASAIERLARAFQQP